jgi:hypothetical protein
VRRLLIVLCATAAAALTHAAPQDRPTPCTAADYRQFDFWIGDWDITQSILQGDGSRLELPAHTSVSSTLDGCALIEHWQGEVRFFWENMPKVEPMTGLSVRAYDPKAGKWFIHWMDSRSTSFGPPYAGGFSGGRGEFFREWETPDGTRVGRITFSDIRPDSVDWELAVSSDGRRTWTVLWTMAMRRHPK